MRVLLCLAGIVCLAILAFSVADVQPTAAQTTARIAMLDNVGPDDGTFVVTGLAAPSAETDSTCWSIFGFASTSPAVIAIHRRINFTGRPVTSRQRVLTSGLLAPGTRLSNLVFTGSCCIDGADYDIWDADVASGRP